MECTARIFEVSIECRLRVVCCRSTRLVQLWPYLNTLGFADAPQVEKFHGILHVCAVKEISPQCTSCRTIDFTIAATPGVLVFLGIVTPLFWVEAQVGKRAPIYLDQPYVFVPQGDTLVVGSERHSSPCRNPRTELWFHQVPLKSTDIQFVDENGVGQLFARRSSVSVPLWFRASPVTVSGFTLAKHEGLPLKLRPAPNVTLPLNSGRDSTLPWMVSS